MAVRGIRGATTCAANTPADILAATRELLVELVEVNHIQVQDIAAVIFSLTDDLDAVFPAAAAREMGWQSVPLFCCQEINVPDSLKRCLRVLILLNIDQPQNSLTFVYLHEAKKLRPDLT